MQPTPRKETDLERATLRQEAAARALLADGGWIECEYCCHEICADNDDTDLTAVIYDGSQVFCGPPCKAALARRIEAQSNRACGFALEMLAKRPDLTWTAFYGYWPSVSCRADFTFPGCKYGGTALRHIDTDEIEWRIARGDLKAWTDYEKARRPVK